MLPRLTLRMREVAPGTPTHDSSFDRTWCDMEVRTTQIEAVMTPNLIKRQRANYVLNLILRSRKRKAGNAAQMKYVTMEKDPWMIKIRIIVSL